MNVILIKTRENTKEKVEVISKERRNKDETFCFSTSSSNPCIGVVGLAVRHRFILVAVFKCLYMILLLKWKLHSSTKPAKIQLRIT